MSLVSRATTVQSRPPENRMAILASDNDARGGTGTCSTRSRRDSVRWCRSCATDDDCRVSLLFSIGVVALKRAILETWVNAASKQRLGGKLASKTHESVILYPVISDGIDFS